MTDKEMLQAMTDLIKLELKPVNERLDKVDERLNKIEADLAQVKEDTAIMRRAVNTILDRADDASIQVIPVFNRKSKQTHQVRLGSI